MEEVFTLTTSYPNWETWSMRNMGLRILRNLYFCNINSLSLSLSLSIYIYIYIYIHIYIYILLSTEYSSSLSQYRIYILLSTEYSSSLSLSLSLSVSMVLNHNGTVLFSFLYSLLFHFQQSQRTFPFLSSSDSEK